MGRDLKSEVEIQYYYDSHPTQEDLMGDSVIHTKLIDYLKDVLSWHFRGQRCAIYSDLNFYQTTNPGEDPIVPDIAVIKGVEEELVTSWKIPLKEQVPHVVFEIASKSTWRNDVKNKPIIYAGMGVQEYFFYDPERLMGRKYQRRQLLGWQLNPLTGDMQELAPDRHGALWSDQLESWLIPDEAFLRLADDLWHIRPTGVEAETQRAKVETQRAEAEAQRAERAEQKAEALARENAALLQRLRFLEGQSNSGINPDDTIEKLQ